MNEMEPRREQAGFMVTAFMDRIMQIPGMRERIEAACRAREQTEEARENAKVPEGRTA